MKPRGYWNKERCHDESLKYNTKTEFQYGSKGAYANALKNGFLCDICTHMSSVGHLI